MTMSRRELLGWFRRPSVEEPSAVEPVAAKAPAFSLDAFYAKRDVDRTIPAFAIASPGSAGARSTAEGGAESIRATTAAETTRVGVGPVEAASAASATADVTTIAPGLVPAVLEHRCLATRSFCSVCVERCPIPGAIVITLGRPRVDPARCNGCGRCVATCPAPVLAFELVPRVPSEKESP